MNLGFLASKPIYSVQTVKKDYWPGEGWSFAVNNNGGFILARRKGHPTVDVINFRNIVSITYTETGDKNE